MKIEFAGLKTTGKVDTVWVVIDLGKHRNSMYYQNYIIAWGRRGGKLQCITRYGYRKVTLNGNGYSRFSQVGQLINKKIGHGYERIDEDKLNDVYPEFEKDIKKLSFWETLKL